MTPLAPTDRAALGRTIAERDRKIHAMRHDLYALVAEQERDQATLQADAQARHARAKMRVVG